MEIDRPCFGILANLRVLIAEDQWLLADTLAVLLKGEGATVIGPFPTTTDAVRAASDGHVDFALVDMGLKDAFADELIDLLETKRVPYAVMTGFAYLPTNAHEGALEVIKKPIDWLALIALLRTFAPPLTR